LQERIRAIRKPKSFAEIERLAAAVPLRRRPERLHGGRLERRPGEEA
jgi:hypothetical protein